MRRKMPKKKTAPMQPEFAKHLKAGLRGAPKPLRGKFHALSADQIKIMLNAGFLKKEIREFDENTTTDFESRTFQNMIRSRKKYVEAMKLNNWTGKEIASRIYHYLRAKKSRSPWDFFRLEYATVSQKPTLTGGKFSQFLKQRREISASFGRAYGRIQSVKQHHYRGLKGLPKKR